MPVSHFESHIAVSETQWLRSNRVVSRSVGKKYIIPMEGFFLSNLDNRGFSCHPFVGRVFSHLATAIEDKTAIMTTKAMSCFTIAPK